MTTHASPRAAAEAASLPVMPTTPAVATRRPSIPLRDIILGGQDGLVNVLGLSLGMAAATADTHVVIVAGVAAMLAESIAMAGVAYTAAGAERERTGLVAETVLASIHARADERHHAAAEAAEASGMDADVIRAALADEADAWQEEVAGVRRELAPLSEARPAAAAAIVGFSTIAGSAVPLVPFLLLPIEVAPWAALTASCAVLLLVGGYRARVAGGGSLRAGAQMAAIGLVSALAGYAIGIILRVPAA